MPTTPSPTVAFFTLEAETEHFHILKFLEPTEWTLASAYCQREHVDHLIGSIHSIEENKEITEVLQNSTISNSSAVWIGLHSGNGEMYEWEDETLFENGCSFSHLLKSAPNASLEESCVKILPDGSWKSGGCRKEENVLYVVCNVAKGMRTELPDICVPQTVEDGDEENEKSRSTAEYAGLIVGCIAGCCILLLVIGFLQSRRVKRERRETKESEEEMVQKIEMEERRESDLSPVELLSENMHPPQHIVEDRISSPEPYDNNNPSPPFQPNQPEHFQQNINPYENEESEKSLVLPESSVREEVFPTENEFEKEENNGMGEVSELENKGMEADGSQQTIGENVNKEANEQFRDEFDSELSSLDNSIAKDERRESSADQSGGNQFIPPPPAFSEEAIPPPPNNGTEVPPPPEYNEDEPVRYAE